VKFEYRPLPGDTEGVLLWNCENEKLDMQRFLGYRLSRYAIRESLVGEEDPTNMQEMLGFLDYILRENDLYMVAETIVPFSSTRGFETTSGRVEGVLYADPGFIESNL